MTSVFSRSALLAGVMSLGCVAYAVAAPAAPAAPEAKVEKRVIVVRTGDGPDGAGGRGEMRFHRADPAKRAEHLRDILQLTPAQEPALQAYLEGTKMPEMTGEHRMGDDGDKGEHKPMTALERLAKQEEMMARHRAMFDKRASAIRAFYAQLSPSQKKAYDALPPMFGPMMMMHGPHHPGGPGMERRVKVIRGESGPDGKMTWETSEGDDIDGSFVIGQLGDMGDFDIMIAPPPPPEPPAPPMAPKAPKAPPAPPAQPAAR